MRQSQLRKDIFCFKKKTQVRLSKWRTSLTVERLRLTPPLPELAPVVCLWVNIDFEDQNKSLTERSFSFEFWSSWLHFPSGKHCSSDTPLTVCYHQTKTNWYLRGPNFFTCLTLFYFYFFSTLIVNMYTSDWRRLAMRGPSNGDSSSLLSPIVAEKKFAWISSVSNRLSYHMHHQSICERIGKGPNKGWKHM